MLFDSLCSVAQRVQSRVAPRSRSIQPALPRLHGMGMMKLHFGNGSKSLRRVAGGRRCYRVETDDEYSSLLLLIHQTSAGT
jgi:hypothetical protein